MLTREVAQQLVLRRVRVLKLVHHHVAPPVRQRARKLRVIPADLQHPEDQITKVDAVRVAQRALIGVVEPRVFLGRRRMRHLMRLRGRAPCVFVRLDHVAQPRHFAAIRLRVAVGEHLLDQRLLVGFVVDHEVAIEPQPVRVLPQQPRTQTVKGRDRDAPRLILVVVAEQPVDALAHLRRRLVRERHGEDLVGRDPHIAHHVRDPVGDHPRLAAPRTSEDEQRPFHGFSRFPLRRIQRVQDRRIRVAASPLHCVTPRHHGLTEHMCARMSRRHRCALVPRHGSGA